MEIEVLRSEIEALRPVSKRGVVIWVEFMW